MSLRKLIASIKRNKTFLITSHVSLEGDALGSEIAFYRLLKKLGKIAYIVNDDCIPYNYNFLPDVDKITRFKKGLKKIEFDCFVILDCSDLERCGDVKMLATDKILILNIDHHTSNTRFGGINWVESGVSSAAQMVYELYKEMGVKLDKEAALALYVGILTDTGSFRYSNTRSYTHKIVSELMKYKFNITDIYKNVYENMSFQDMKLLMGILPKVKLDSQGKIAWLQIKKGLLKGKKVFFDLSEYVLSFARAIKGIEVAVLFKENPGTKNEIRVNLRSQGKVDVNRIAGFFGGGGHRTASGATVKGSPTEVRKKVLAKIKDSL
jgi:phosphoesterase RecJ-like protein